jgi:hypothetical protein
VATRIIISIAVLDSEAFGGPEGVDRAAEDHQRKECGEHCLADTRGGWPNVEVYVPEADNA